MNMITDACIFMGIIVCADSYREFCDMNVTAEPREFHEYGHTIGFAIYSLVVSYAHAHCNEGGDC